MCAGAIQLAAFADRFWVQCKRVMAETERETELTTVVLDGDIIGQQLVLASHSNEQRTSSPGWRSGGRMENLVRGERQEVIKVWRCTTLSDTDTFTVHCCVIPCVLFLLVLNYLVLAQP